MDGHNHPIRVLVVDLDSPLRDALVAFLSSSPGIEVAGVGSSSQDILNLTQQVRPDIVALGGPASGAGGVRAIRQIMQTAPTRILVMTPPGSRPGSERAAHDAAEVLQAGALSIVGEPAPTDPGSYSRFLETVRLMAEVPVIHHWGRAIKPAPDLVPGPLAAQVAGPEAWASRLQQVEVIGIAASTGGPAALTTLFKDLPADFSLPILLVQHVSHGSAGELRRWLDGQTALRVRQAANGEQLEAGCVFLAPDDFHMRLDALGRIVLSQEAPYKGLRPSANVLFASLARIYGPQALCIVLTGMGDDGVDGLEQLYRARGLTIAQDEQSSVVHGMPGEAIRRRAAERVLGLEEIAGMMGRLQDARRRIQET
ncbi:MAG: chemotaxis protein CheB [Anaerolineae bacterium]|nr:chemotaxis protein CheB [Anaerolineae bacterium]